MSKQFNLGRLFVELEASTKGLDADLGQAEKSFGRFTTFVKANPLVALASLGAAAGAAALKAASMAADFEHSITEVGTLVDKNVVDMGRLADGTLALFRSMPIGSLKDMTSGLYNIVSAGVPAGETINYLRIAAQAAVGGVTDVNTAVDGLTTATNAFASQGLTATDAADAMFTAIRLGKTTFGELSGSLGKVAGLANSVGISFDELLANTAALTLGGVNTSEAMGALRQVLSNVAKPTAELRKAYPDLAKEFDLTALKTKGLTGFLVELAGRIGNNTDAATKMFGSVEGLNAVLTLTANGGAKVAEITEAMTKKAGAAKQAYDEMSGTTKNLHQILKNQFTTALIELGQVVLPAVNLALQATTGLMQGLLSVIDVIKNKGNVLEGFWMGPSEIANMQQLLKLPIFGGAPIDLTNLQAGSREFRYLTSAIASVGTATAQNYLPAFEASTEALTAMRATVEAYAKAHVRSLDATAPATETLARRYLLMLQRIDAEIKKRSKTTDGPPPLDKPSLEAAKERAKALEAIAKLSNESQLSLLTEQQRAFLDLTAKFQDQIAKLSGDDRARAEAALKTAQGNLLQRWAGFNAELTPQITHGTTLLVDNSKLQGMAMDDLAGDLDRLNVTTGRYTAAQVEAARKAQAWRDELLRIANDVTTTAHRMQDLAHNLEPLFGRAFVDQIDQAVSAIDDMGKAVSRIATGDILGGVTQGVGALVSLGKTIFGSSDGLKKALGDNNTRLRELRTTMGDLITIQQSGREIVGIQTALQRVLPKVSGKLDSDERRLLDLELLKVGLDRQALNDMAEALGIRIRDDKGELQADLLRNLLRAIGMLDTEWAQTYRGQRDRISQGVSIGAITNELAEAVALLSDPKLGSGAIAQALAQFDLASTTGRAGAIAALQDLFKNIGSLDVGQLGGLNRSEFLGAIEWLTELLSAANTAADQQDQTDAAVEKARKEAEEEAAEKARKQAEDAAKNDPRVAAATSEQERRIRDLMDEFGFASAGRQMINKALSSGLITQTEADALIARIRADVLDAATEEEAAAYRAAADAAIDALKADLAAGTINQARFDEQQKAILDALERNLGPGLTEAEALAIAEPFGTRYRDFLLGLDVSAQTAADAVEHLGAAMTALSAPVEAILAEINNFKPIGAPSLPPSAGTVAGLAGVRVKVTIGDINIHLPAGTQPDDARTLAAAVAEELTDRLDEELASRFAYLRSFDSGAGR